MKYLSVTIAFAIYLMATTPAAESKGRLFIIGGGRQPSGMLNHFVDLAGGTNDARLIVLPMASEDAEQTGKSQVADFKSLGVRHVESVVLNRAESLNSSSASRLDGATGIYFSGGDQSRLAEILVNSPIQKKLKQLYADGAVIAGTSAGAAIMSEVMITGEELLNQDKTNTFTSIKKNNIQTVAGLGFLTNAIIDQHFIKRKRLNRLFSVVLDHPQLIGIGIDESTAIIVNPDATFEATGSGAVMVIDARASTQIHTNKLGDLSARDIKTHLLVAGDRFNMNQRVKTPPSQ